MSDIEHRRLLEGLEGVILTEEQELVVLELLIADIRAERGIDVPIDPDRSLLSDKGKSLLAIQKIKDNLFSPLVSIKDGWVSIKTHAPDETYEFSLSRCDTPERLLRWISHLCEKTWVRMDHIKSLVHTVSSHFKWNV
jgi:hypothetical protein